MEIQTLKVFVSAAELQELARQNQPPDAPVKNLAVRVTPDGIHVSGEVAMMITMAFDSVWKPSVADGRVTIHLAGLTAAGFPVTRFRPLVMAALKDAIKEPGVQVIEEAVVLDVQEIVRRQELPVKVSFEVQAIHCIEGGVVAEAGLPKAPTSPAV